ncbi:MAG: hypothetical protein ACI32Y_05660 [Clostridium sp.]
MSKKCCMTKAPCCNCRGNNNYNRFNNRLNNRFNNNYGNFFGYGGFFRRFNRIWPLLLLFLLYR